MLTFIGRSFGIGLPGHRYGICKIIKENILFYSFKLFGIGQSDKRSLIVNFASMVVALKFMSRLWLRHLESLRPT